MLAKETLNEIPGQLLNWYRRHNIRPYQSTEETRSMLQKQLSMKTGQQTPVPPYYSMLKQRMLDQCQQMGMDPFEVQDFIEQKGLYEYNINVVLDQMKNPGYVNPLRRQMVMYQQPQFMGS